MRRALIYGLALWVAGTAGIRLWGQGLLRTEAPGGTAVLYAASFFLMAWVMPRICKALKIEPGRWFEATVAVMLPTLLLDPWACVFFSAVYPNLEPGAAGIFGGWMLVFCAGAVAGVAFRQRR